MSDIKDKKGLGAAIVELIGAPLTEKLKGVFAKFNAIPATPATPATPVAMDKTMKTKDGAITVSIAGEPAEGVAVMDITSGAPVALADGTYELEDGASITVSGGVITAVTAAAAPATPGMDMTAKFAAQYKTDFAAMETKYKKLEAENAEHKKQIADLIELNKPMVEFMTKLMETPVKQPVKREIPENLGELKGKARFQAIKKIEAQA